MSHLHKLALLIALGVLLPLAQPGRAHPAVEERLARLGLLIDAHPQAQGLYLRRAELLTRHGQWQAATRDLEVARTLGHPDEAGFASGLLHYTREDYKRARTELSRFLALHPQQGEALLYRARAAAAAGDPHDALADYQRYFEMAESPHPGDVLAAARLLALGDSGDGAAIALLDRGMGRLGPQPQLQRYAMELELQRGDPEAALRRCRELGPVLGQSPRWRVDLSELLQLAGRGDEAARELQRARSELQALRPTPARQQLLARIEQLDAF